MKNPFATTAVRLFSLALLSTAGLFTAACSKDEVAADTKDYTQIDEDIIKNFLTAAHDTTAQRQASGLYYLPVVTNPSGVRATAGKTVSVLYTGMFLNGQVFDASSLHGNSPISFVLGQGQVIAGWDEGIALMRKGEKGQLFIPSKLAYGASGAGSIPPNTVLRFEVELVDVK
jgi:FKBP-type peptidyl-prolyl cis-trans isomerase